MTYVEEVATAEPICTAQKFERVSKFNIQSLKPNEIFVFGSNELGRHGKGAALAAIQKFGAKCGVGYGLQGQSFAIPTKSNPYDSLPIGEIKIYVDQFIEFAKENKHLIFMITEIGCGLARFKVEQIAPLFTNAINLENIYLPKRFVEVIK